MRRLVPTIQVAVKSNTCQSLASLPPPVPHLLGPVIHRLWVVYLLAKPGDHLGRCPLHTLGGGRHWLQAVAPPLIPTMPSANPSPCPAPSPRLLQPHFCVLFQHHLVQNGHQPVLKLAVVVIGHQQVSNPGDRRCMDIRAQDPQSASLTQHHSAPTHPPVDPVLTKLLPPEAEFAQVCGRQALDEILLHTPSCGH